MDFDVTTLDSLKRKELQILCKKVGIRANSKTETLVEDLRQYHRMLGSNTTSVDDNTPKSDEISAPTSTITRPVTDEATKEETFVSETQVAGAGIGTEEHNEALSAQPNEATIDDVLVANIDIAPESDVQVATELVSVCETLETAKMTEFDVADSIANPIEKNEVSAQIEITTQTTTVGDVSEEGDAKISKEGDAQISKEEDAKISKEEDIKSNETTPFVSLEDYRRQIIISNRKVARSKEISVKSDERKHKNNLLHNKVSGTQRPSASIKGSTGKNVVGAKKDKHTRIDFDKVHEEQFKKMKSINELQVVKNASGVPKPVVSQTLTPIIPTPEVNVAPKVEITLIKAQAQVAPTKVFTATLPKTPVASKPKPTIHVGTPIPKASTENSLSKRPVLQPRSSTKKNINSAKKLDDSEKAKKPFTPYTGKVPKFEGFSLMGNSKTPVKQKVVYDPKKSISEAKKKRETSENENPNPISAKKLKINPVSP